MNTADRVAPENCRHTASAFLHVANIGDDMLTQERLKELLHYDPDTGLFIWKRRDWLTGKASAWNTKYSGKQAGCIDRATGYIVIRIDKNNLYAHRLAYLYVYGVIPDEIDHADTDRLNNCISNLRPATASQQKKNQNMRITNSSGFKGVYKHTKNGNYCAQICIDGKSLHLGVADTAEEAHKLYVMAADKYFGEYANHG